LIKVADRSDSSGQKYKKESAGEFMNFEGSVMTYNGHPGISKNDGSFLFLVPIA
jgi:hypothetical protein